MDKDERIDEYDYLKSIFIPELHKTPFRLKTTIELEKASFSAIMYETEVGQKFLQKALNKTTTFINRAKREAEKIKDKNARIKAYSETPKAITLLNEYLYEKWKSDRTNIISKKITKKDIDRFEAVKGAIEHSLVTEPLFCLTEVLGIKRLNEKQIKAFWYWIVQNPKMIEDFHQSLPKPTKLSQKPLSELSEWEDWLQAFYELSFGYHWPSGEDVLNELNRFPVGSHANERTELLQKLRLTFFEQRQLFKNSLPSDLKNNIENVVNQFREGLILESVEELSMYKTP